MSAQAAAFILRHVDVQDSDMPSPSPAGSQHGLTAMTAEKPMNPRAGEYGPGSGILQPTLSADSDNAGLLSVTVSLSWVRSVTATANLRFSCDRRKMKRTQVSAQPWHINIVVARGVRVSDRVCRKHKLAHIKT